MYNDGLDMLPDADVEIRKPPISEFFADLRQDPIRWRASLYNWICFLCCGGHSSTFGFYMPVIFTMVGVSSLIGTSLSTGFIWFVAGIAAWVGPAVLPKLGHRGTGIAGFATVIVDLSLAAFVLYTASPYILPVAAAMMRGHTWAVTTPLTIATVVSRAEYRGIAGGVTQGDHLHGDIPVPLRLRGNRSGQREPTCDPVSAGRAARRQSSCFVTGSS